MRALVLGALLLGGCATVPVVEVKCYPWVGLGEVRTLTGGAGDREFVCGERICYSMGPGRGQDGACFYGCPERRLPEYCVEGR